MGRNKKIIKIAMLGHKRIPSREGGIEIVVEELATRLVDLGCEVTCYNRSGHHVSGKEFDLINQKEYKGIRLKKVFTIPYKGLAAVSASFFAGIAVAFGKYDVVHFHAEGPCMMLWLPKMHGKRCIATIHGLDHQRAKWGKFAAFYIMLGERTAVKYADAIIVLSTSAQDYFEKKYARKTICIPNGVNRPCIRNAYIIKKKWGLEKDSYLLFLGRLVPEKGLKYLIDAYRKVQTEKKLVIAGGSSDSVAYVNDIKGKCKDREDIIFTGFVQGELLDELYSNAYLYILPSDLEGMPLSLLEAMSYGNCCVVSDIDECVSVVEDKGVVFKKGDVEDLHEKLQTLCNDKATVQKYKEETIEYICNKYNWDEVVKKTLKLYESSEKY